jgi:hypothetical protein
VYERVGERVGEIVGEDMYVERRERRVSVGGRGDSQE